MGVASALPKAMAPRPAYSTPVDATGARRTVAVLRPSRAWRAPAKKSLAAALVRRVRRRSPHDFAIDLGDDTVIVTSELSLEGYADPTPSGQADRRERDVEVVRQQHVADRTAVHRAHGGVAHTAQPGRLIPHLGRRGTGERGRGQYTCVLGSDVLYEARAVEPVADSVRWLLAPGGEAWIADPGRPHLPSFLTALAARGLAAERFPCGPTTLVRVGAVPAASRLD